MKGVAVHIFSRRILALSILTLAAANVVAQGNQVDLLIQNARIIDGTGSPWFRSDVAINDGRIVDVGVDLNIDASQTIDAAGRVVAPGFIDVHTHVESSDSRDGLQRLPRADNYLLDGVTTIVTGNCGGSEIDIEAWNRSLVGLGINVATLVGHNSVRRNVMGLDDRAPTAQELEQMRSLVDQAMQDGAVGFSTGLLYVPGTYATTEEVISLAEVASRHGGVYASHIRDQGERLHESIDEAVRVGREANMPVQISHFKIKGPARWGSIGDAIELVESYRRGGVDVVIDAYPYDRASSNLGINLPRWAVSGDAEEIAARIRDDDTHSRLVGEMKSMLDDGGYPDYSFATVAQYRPEPSYIGRTISEINRLVERPGTTDAEIETVLDMMVEGGEAGSIYGASMIYHYMSLDDVDTIFRYPNAAVASDGTIMAYGRGQPHPRSYGTNARVLGDFVRERQVLTLEDAIRRMTSLPARTFSFHDRGIVRPGFAADLVLFDPETVADKATFEDPHQYSVGFDYVIVNGVAVVAEGEMTDERSGQFIKGPGAN
ncbi:D-aminoacylase domain protein [uncultured Woeseiaceae bacterium]|uniref:D-aminoacylase domain protein n=1 Tax=uncultured Woeseiaceae bacterium TaxID=1983305 RepID=A0A7D9D212_9GAMM|nr:D-aminoacylase domain protein [uncultured Woeseiaceae bacterium]